jgi:hypothetical protein
MKTITTLLLLSIFCVPVLAQHIKELPGKGTYDHVGLVLGYTFVKPDFRVDLDERTIQCWDSVCSSHGDSGLFYVTLENGKKALVNLLAVSGDGTKFPLNDLKDDKTQPDKHFKYRDVRNPSYPAIFGNVGYGSRLLCVPGRNKKGHETKKEVCYHYF